MDHPFLMRMLDRTAYLHEQLQSLARREIVLLAIIRDLDPPDQLHHEVGSARGCGPSIDNPGNVRMIHPRYGLAFGFEASDHLFGIHPEFDDLERHTPFDRRLLLCQVNHAKTTVTDFFQQCESPYLIPRFLAHNSSPLNLWRDRLRIKAR